MFSYTEVKTKSEQRKNAMWELCSAMECMLHAVKHMMQEHDELQETLEDKISTMEDMQERIDELTAQDRAKEQGK